MGYEGKIVQQAIKLRRKGYSLGEIKNILHVSRSSVGLWAKEVKLDQNAKGRIQYLRKCAREKAWRTISKKREERVKKSKLWAEEKVRSIHLTKEQALLACSLLYWAEGGKTKKAVDFINSDPEMIKVFLRLFRYVFPVNETKLRICVHVHEYHNVKAIINFWSEITSIPPEQFNKPYIKPHTKKVIREGYMGCITIIYGDIDILRKIIFTYKVFTRELDSGDMLQ